MLYSRLPRNVWEAAVEELLVCEREPENASDRYAVAVKKGTIIGNLPQKVSWVCSLFLRREGSYNRIYSNREQEIFS